jgi:hypothetical protein
MSQCTDSSATESTQSEPLGVVVVPVADQSQYCFSAIHALRVSSREPKRNVIFPTRQLAKFGQSRVRHDQKNPSCAPDNDDIEGANILHTSNVFPPIAPTSLPLHRTPSIESILVFGSNPDIDTVFVSRTRNPIWTREPFHYNYNTIASLHGLARGRGVVARHREI